jgi:oligopeptide transport system substrate-binding protein
MPDGLGISLRAALVAFALTGISTAGPGAEKILRIGNQTEPAELDPHLIRGLPEFRIVWALSEGLVALHPTTMEPIPGAARSWEVSEDGLTYRFHLQPDGKWSNGDPVEARDFVFAFRRVLRPEVASPYASLLFVLRNGRAFYEGTIDDFSAVGVRAPSPGLLELELEHPVPYFLRILNLPVWHPVHPPTIRAFDPEGGKATGWSRPGHHIGNGPFQLEDWRLNQRIDLRRNPHYWDAARVRLDGIAFLPVSNAYTEERAFRAGLIDVTSGIPMEKVERLIESGDPHLQIAPDFGVYYFGFNVRHPPLDDPRIRRALSLVVDRSVITDNIRRRGESVAHHFTPPGIEGYQPPVVPRKNAPKARQLLAEAGYPEGAGFPRLRLLFNTSETHRPISEALQAMWARELGIHIVLENTEWRTYLDRRSRGDFQIIRAGWIGDYLDPSTFLDLWRSDSTHNYYGWSDPDYDQKLDAAAAESDPERRMNLLAGAERIFLEDDLVIPIFFYNRAFLMSPAVRNWPMNLLTYPRYQEVDLQRR